MAKPVIYVSKKPKPVIYVSKQQPSTVTARPGHINPAQVGVTPYQQKASSLAKNIV